MNLSSSVTQDRYDAVSSRGLATLLARHAEKMLVLVAQDLAHWHAGEIAGSANQVALANGYRLISLDFHRSLEREREILLTLCEVPVQGIIFLWDYSPCNLDLYERLARERACVQVIDPKPVAGLDFVGVDEYSGGLLAVRHLINLGYRQIGHITLEGTLQCLTDRRTAYMDAMRQTGLPVCDEWTLRLPYGMADHDRIARQPAMRRFLSQPQPPSALFVCADWVANELIECAQEMGLSVPEDLAIVGYDDSLPYSLTGVPLSTVRIDPHQIGRLAVERLLLRSRDGVQTAPCNILIPPLLVVRESSARTTATTERWALVTRHLQDNFRRDVSARELASLVGLDPSYFSSQFRLVFGRRFTHYLHELRLHYAAQLLVTTDATIEMIASDSGFASLNHFYVLFKRTFGASPHAYRRQKLPAMRSERR